MARDADSSDGEKRRAARRHPGSLVVLTLLLAACASRGPFAGPPAVSTLEHFNGSPLSGPLPEVAKVTSGDAAWSLAITVAALRDLPETSLDSIASRARFVAQPDTLPSLRIVPGITRGARFGEIDDAAAFLQRIEQADPGGVALLGQHADALPAGVTSLIDVGSPVAVVLQGGWAPLQPGLSVEIHRPTNAAAEPELVVSLTLAARPLPPREPVLESDDDADLPLPVMPLQRELIVWQLVERQPPYTLAVLSPSPFESELGAAIVTLIEVSPPVEDDTALGVTLDDMLRSASRTRESTRNPAADPGLAHALDALVLPSRRRAALLWLSSRTDAFLARDIALADRAGLVTSLADSMAEERPEPPADSDPSAVALALEHAAYITLIAALEAGDAKPSVEALLLLHAGELGRNPALLGDLVEGLGTLQALRERIVAENVRLLGDGSPATRVRAYDWLERRGAEPPCYKPLADRATRQAALRAFEEDPAKAAAACDEDAS
jgi:hypothetical protein